MKQINQSIKKSSNQSINQSANQSISQSNKHPIIQLINQSINQSNNHPIIQSINQSINQTIIQYKIIQSINQKNNQSINQSNNHPIEKSFNPCIHQSINQSVKQVNWSLWFKALGVHHGFCSLKRLEVFLVYRSLPPAFRKVAPTISTEVPLIFLGGEGKHCERNGVLQKSPEMVAHRPNHLHCMYEYLLCSFLAKGSYHFVHHRLHYFSISDPVTPGPHSSFASHKSIILWKHVG